MIKKALFVFSILASIAAAATTITWKDLQASIDSWINGPVTLVLTDQEKDVYKKLKTPEEKMEFIKIFWARRDPILRTRENEFKEEFYRRVQYVNENFGEGHTPGWMSARGQVYILFGPPSREEKKIVEESNRPALLWVYDKIPSDKIPRNEALLFVFRDIKYVLLPPNPDPGDVLGAQQRALDSGLRYQTIPSVVQQAFVDASKANVIDEKKDYKDLLYSVQSTVKFGVSEINFDVRIQESHPPRIQVAISTEDAPVYDDGNKVFAEYYVKQELKKGDILVSANEHMASFSWDQKSFGEMKEIAIQLPALRAPAGEYTLWVTVQDRISNVSETKQFPISY